MSANNLVPGRAYILDVAPWKEEDFLAPALVHNLRYALTPVRYVRKERLPQIGGDWETFYTIDGSKSCMKTDWVSMGVGILQRIRIPAGEIYAINDTLYLGDLEAIRCSAIIDERHTPIVDSWIQTVREINASLPRRPNAPVVRVTLHNLKNKT